MDFLSTLPFWKDLTQEEQEQLRQGAQMHHFKKGDIMDQGTSQCTGLEMIIEGQVRVFLPSPQGNEITLYRLLEQDVCILSAGCMFPSLTFDISMEFEEDTRILLLPKQLLHQLSEKNGKVKDFTMELMTDRFSSVMNTMYDVMFSNNEHRLAQALYTQIQLQGSLSLSLTHEQLAKELGTAREVISRLLKQLQKEGILKQSRGCVTILDEHKLNAI